MLLLRPPGVYRVDTDSTLLADLLARTGHAEGRDVLDVCAGTGVLALSAARAGARSITAVDLSLRSTMATWLNCRLHGAPVTVLRGDLFGPVLGRRFDLVVANPPYVPSRASAPARHRIGRCWDAGQDGRLMLDRICAGVSDVLAEDGTLLLVQSEVCGEDVTLSRLAKAGLAAKVVDRAVLPFGPVMSARAALLEARGLIAPGQREEEIVVVQANRG
ncbi:MAG TPA: HemK2/MTQ2 family protein methyltransferase [Pseudonocardia sp.]|uniref:HemK2/MTQ2 family protein methyltransferase n=1 Tax=Pseudonocardia sp. TaxID=60912 RepID=UPI002EDA5F47